MTSNTIDLDSASPSERRAAITTVRVLESQPQGRASLGEVSARRCHRNFTEEEPSQSAIVSDLQIAAYAEGGNAIHVTGFEKLNGLAADCWYVLEGRAEVYK